MSGVAPSGFSPALTWALAHFEVEEGVLRLGGEPVDAWAARLGTPAYLYSRGAIARRVAEMREVIGPEVHLNYAAKANPHPEVLATMVALGVGFDVASGGELARVLAAGAPAERVGFAGPGKRPFEHAAAVTAGIGCLSIESPGELLRAAEVARTLGRRLDVALRLNPPQALARAGQRMTGGSRPFGVDTEQAPALLSHLRELPSLRFAGFHCFAGAQVLEAEVLAAQLDQTFETLGALLPICPEPPRVLNLGGGFGIPYTAQDTPLDLRAAGAAVAARVAQHRVSFPEARFVIELGRALVGGAGLYLTRVLDRKVSRGTTFLVLDGGLHHCLAATGNFGQVIHRPYPVCAPAHIGVPTEAWETVALAGPLCTPLDTFGAKVALPPLHEGDLVAVMCTGAYGRTASPEAFLSHPAPAEAMVP